MRSSFLYIFRYDNYDAFVSGVEGSVTKGTSGVESLRVIGELLTSVWCGVMSFSDVELGIDEDDREDIKWWLGKIRRIVRETTKREEKEMVNGCRYDLSFEFDDIVVEEF